MSILKGPWSYTRATACSRALYMEKVLRAPPEPRPERFLGIDRRDFGSILHLGAEIVIKAIVAGNQMPNVRELTQELLKSYIHLSSIAGEIEERLELFIGTFRCEWNQDVVERDAWLRDHVLGSEMRLAIDANDSPCAFKTREEMERDGDEITDNIIPCPEDGWRGIIDYSEFDDGLLTVIDFKNRPAIFTKAELKLDEQLAGYVHIAMCHYPDQVKSVRAGIHYFEFGYTQLLDMELEEIEAVVAHLRARAAAKLSLAKDDIGPEPGFGKCQYCDYISTCDAGKEYVHGGKLMATDADQARQLANWVMVNEEKVKAGKAALKAFTAEFGAIELDDKTRVGHSLSLDGVDYDYNLTLRIIKKLINDGVVKKKLSDFTSLDKRAVDGIAKKEPILEALAPARSSKADPKFGFFKPAKAEGVRTVKEGRKTVVHPEDRRKTQARVKTSGGKA